MKCQICKRDFSTLRSLSIHLRKHRISSKKYYEQYLMKEGEDRCILCGRPSAYFRNLRYGFFKYCDKHRKHDMGTYERNEYHRRVNSLGQKRRMQSMTPEQRKKVFGTTRGKKRPQSAIDKTIATWQRKRELGLNKRSREFARKVSEGQKRRYREKGLAEKQKEVHRKQREQGRKKITCVGCGKEFEVIRSSNRKYCSRSCHVRYNPIFRQAARKAGAERKGKNNPMVNPDVRAKAAYRAQVANRECPNKAERKLIRVLEDYGSDFYYTGDGTFWLGDVEHGKRNPDFVHSQAKKVLELAGEHWHSPEYESESVQHYSKFGFDCLVVWDSELENVDSLARKLRRFEHEQ